MTKSVRKRPSGRGERIMAKMTFLAAEGCLFSGISGLVDAFYIANLWNRTLNHQGPDPLFETEIVTVEGDTVLASGGIRVHPDRAMRDVNRTDLILIPPILPVDEPLTPRMGDISDWLIDRYRKKTNIAAMCTGTFMLAETGLLDGKIATTNWQFGRRFRRRYPKVHLRLDRVLTEDGGLICTGAATSMYNLGLHLIRTFGSEALASVCSKALLVDPNRDSQAPYFFFSARKDHGDKDILEAQAWMEKHYGDPITIDAIAGKAGISPRHFKRRFRKATGESPLGYLQNLRMEAAKRRLETTLDNVNEITCRIGYEDSSTFRRLFKRHTGISPREYRDKFSRSKNPTITAETGSA
jgi:transcriptional regulator GlxA family with amidase domain